MLQKLKDKASNWIIKFFLIMVSLSFVLWGTSSIWQLFTGEDIIVEINDDSISFNYFEQALSQKRQTLTRETRSSSLVEQYQDAAIRKELLEEIINTTLFDQGAKDDSIGLSEKQVDQIIVNQPAFHVDGVFNLRSYEEFLERSRVSSNNYKEYIRENFRQGIYKTGIDNSAFFTLDQLDFYANWQHRKYSYKYLQISSEDFTDNKPVEDGVIRTFYADNIDDYYLPKEFHVSYFIISSENTVNDIEILDEEIEAAYFDNYGYLYQDVNITLRHIFFADEEGINKDLITQAEDIKESITSQEDFIKAVAENSEDQATLEKGGVLSASSLGDLPPSFVDTIRKMAKGEKVGGPFRSQLGVHLIWIDSISDVNAPNLDTVKEQLEEELRYAKLEEVMLDKAESFSYEILTLNDLQQAANNIGISEGGEQSFVLGDGFAEQFGNIFIEEVLALRAGDTSDVILLDDGRYIAINLQMLQEPKLQSFADVKEQVARDYRLFVAQAKLEEITQEIIVAIESGEQSYENPLNIIPVTRWKSYEWQEVKDLSRSYANDDEIAQLVFSLPFQQLPYAGTKALSDDSFIVVVVEEVIPQKYNDLSASEKIQLKEWYLQNRRQLANALIIDKLRNQADIQINENLLGFQ